MTTQKVTVKNVDPASDPQAGRFAKLMLEYKEAHDKVTALKEKLEQLDTIKKNLRGLLKDEAVNMGLTRGSRLVVADVGTFSFKRERYYRVPAEYRKAMAEFIFETGDEAILEVGKKNLREWVEDRNRNEREVPSFVDYFEDEFVPNVTPKRQPKPKEKTQQ